MYGVLQKHKDSCTGKAGLRGIIQSRGYGKRHRKRIKLDGYVYDVKELKEKYFDKEYLACKFKDIIKCAKYIEELLQFLTEIENINFEATGLKDTDQYYSFLSKSLVDFFYKHPYFFYDDSCASEYFKKEFFCTFSRYSLNELTALPLLPQHYSTIMEHDELDNLRNIYKIDKNAILSSKNHNNIHDDTFHDNFYADKICNLIFYTKREISRFCTSPCFLNNEDKKCMFVIPADYYAKLDAAYHGFTENEKLFNAKAGLTHSEKIKFLK